MRAALAFALGYPTPCFRGCDDGYLVDYWISIGSHRAPVWKPCPTCRPQA